MILAVGCAAIEVSKLAEVITVSGDRVFEVAIVRISSHGFAVPDW
jgi:hypothetical protein